MKNNKYIINSDHKFYDLRKSIQTRLGESHCNYQKYRKELGLTYKDELNNSHKGEDGLSKAAFTRRANKAEAFHKGVEAIRSELATVDRAILIEVNKDNDEKYKALRHEWLKANGFGPRTEYSRTWNRDKKEYEIVKRECKFDKDVTTHLKGDYVIEDGYIVLEPSPHSVSEYESQKVRESYNSDFESNFKADESLISKRRLKCFLRHWSDKNGNASRLEETYVYLVQFEKCQYEGKEIEVVVGYDDARCSIARDGKLASLGSYSMCNVRDGTDFMRLYTYALDCAMDYGKNHGFDEQIIYSDVDFE